MVEKPSRPFCIVKYMASIAYVPVTLRSQVGLQLAIHRFEDDPCICDGCDDLSRETNQQGGRS